MTDFEEAEAIAAMFGRVMVGDEGIPDRSLADQLHIIAGRIARFRREERERCAVFVQEYRERETGNRYEVGYRQALDDAAAALRAMKETS